MARILGVNLTQDASIAIIDTQEQSIIAVRKERLNKIKHSWSELGDFTKYYSKLNEVWNKPFDLVVESYSSDPIRNKKNEIHKELNSFINFKTNPNFVEISHHLAHLYSTLPIMTSNEAVGIVIDCMGSKKDIADQTQINIETSSVNDVEICSIYKVDKIGNFTIIGKQYWDGDWSKPVGLGTFYYLLTKCFYNAPGSEGKVMALASYGNSQKMNLPPLRIEDNYKVFIPDEWLKAFEDTERFCFPKCNGNQLENIYNSKVNQPNLEKDSSDFQKNADLAAIGQKVFQDALLKVILWVLKITNTTEITFSGGTALNCVANGFLIKHIPTVKLSVPGHPDDGGTSIGAAIFGVKKLDVLQEIPVTKLNYWGVNNYLPNICLNQISMFKIEKHIDNSTLIKKVVRLIKKGFIIGLYQGRSEFGPRALGNRTLLGDPRNVDVRDFINFRIKGREWYRPVAPVILEEYANDYFEITQKSDYMQYAVDVKQSKIPSIPAVIHIDNTARLQTLARANNPFLYDLLVSFFKETGVPILINTSLNMKGMPIIETPDEAIEMLVSTHMHALIIDNTLIVKPNLKI